MMLRSLLLMSCCVVVGACTMIKINHDDTTTLTYRGDAGKGQNLATRACRKAGQQRAEILSIVNKDPSLPEGEGRQVATFRCLAN